MGIPGGSAVKNPPAKESQVQSLGEEDPLEKEIAIHSSILAWEIPWTEEPEEELDTTERLHNTDVTLGGTRCAL